LADQTFSIRLRNARKSALNVYLEPWGEIYKLSPNKQMQVDAEGPTGVAPNNMLEVESGEDSVTVWGWGGSAVTVREL